MTDLAHPLSESELRDDIRGFISTILGSMRGNAIMALASGITAGGKLRVDRDHWFAYPAQLDAMVDFAVGHATEDVYLGPTIYGDKISTATKRVSRALSNALGAQTVYMDSDTCPPEAFRVPPSVHVDTSPGHGHDYWVLDRPVAAADAAAVGHRITTAHADQGCDPSGWSQNKLLRVPTMHTHPGVPVPISWESSGAVYTLLEVARAYEDVQVRDAVHSGDKAVGNAQGLLTNEQVADLVASIPTTKRRLTDLLLKRPKEGEKGWRSEQRYALMCELLREGYDPQQTASIVWHAPAGSKWREDARGTDGLWFEVNKAAAEIDLEKGRASVVPISTVPERPKVHDGPTLLLPTERAIFTDRRDFTTLYAADARVKTPVFNAPLHSVNALTVLSMAFGAAAVIPKPEAPMPLNLFSIQISRSSTGKTQASRIMERYIEALYPNDDVFVPVDSSKNALVEHLLERDGSVALLRGDEAHGQFRLMENAQWTAGLRETWTDIYDGKVAGIGRVGQKDLRKRAFVAASMHLSGTPEDMFDTLTRGMFKSGYAARQVWVIGEDHEVTEDTLRTKQGHSDAEWDDLPSYQASLFRYRTAEAKRAAHQQRVTILMTEEALTRFDAAKYAIHKHFEHSDDPEIFTPATRRMFDIIWKVAALFALEDGRARIVKDDVLIALGYAEVWLDTLVVVSRRISSTLFSKACDDIERYVASREGREAPMSAIFARFAGERPKFVEEYVDSLIKQNRVFEPYAKAGGERKIRMKGEAR